MQIARSIFFFLKGSPKLKIIYKTFTTSKFDNEFGCYRLCQQRSISKSKRPNSSSLLLKAHELWQLSVKEICGKRGYQGFSVWEKVITSTYKQSESGYFSTLVLGLSVPLRVKCDVFRSDFGRCFEQGNERQGNMYLQQSVEWAASVKQMNWEPEKG